MKPSRPARQRHGVVLGLDPYDLIPWDEEPREIEPVYHALRILVRYCHSEELNDDEQTT